ncbi:hypothetical protein [Actinomadura kijaniata]|uniref:hypothetical protein n=1 Tax=Actinomadura kijaniata TaxID=46161 RepID=UPI0009FE372D|nr:hypothetical protein [Actinomadura kijaniata]
MNGDHGKTRHRAVRVQESAPDPPASGRRNDGRDDGRDDDAVTELTPEQIRERLRRRAAFLRELAEARELRERVTPHRSRRARIHAALRRRTFRSL